MIICSIVIVINSVLTLQVSTAKPMIADLVDKRLRSSTLDSLHTGVSPGSIGCAYTYSGPFREAQISEQPLWGFPQVILIVPSHVPNILFGRYSL
jgi:hypothetical protein